MDEIEEIIEERQPTEEELEEFKTKVNEWCKLDDQIKKLSIAIRERKKLQQAYAKFIKEFMFKFDYRDVNFENSRIKAVQREIVPPITMTEIKSKILENESLSGKQLLDYIFDQEKRERVLKEYIRRKITMPNIKKLTL